MEEIMKYILTALIITALGISCDMTGIIEDRGSLNLLINDSASRSLVPEISMDADSYQISGLGPDDNVLNLITSQTQNIIDELLTGDWFIVVEALNSDGDIIGHGSGNIAVQGGTTVSAHISVTPLEGFGTMGLTVFWNTEDVADPVISARLIPTSGSDITVSFGSITTETTLSTATSDTSLATGYYTLVIQLLDSDTIIMGSVEAVRIIADQTSSGSFDFTEVNSIGGTIDIEIDVDMENPIELNLTGTEETLTEGSSMSVTVSAPSETTSIAYQWYINGSSEGSGSTVSIGSTLSQGYYRLDVIAISADGNRSGSTNHTFTVTN